MSDWVEWSPPFAPHVKGRYERRAWDAELRKHEPQNVEMTCTACGDTFRSVCEQGRPREHVQTFARLHVHGDALALVKR